MQRVSISQESGYVTHVLRLEPLVVTETVSTVYSQPRLQFGIAQPVQFGLDLFPTIITIILQASDENLVHGHICSIYIIYNIRTCILSIIIFLACWFGFCHQQPYKVGTRDGTEWRIA